MSDNRLATVDIETLGTEPDSLILSIGIALFDPNDFEASLVPNLFLPSLEEQLALGRKVDPNTSAWWVKQSEEARAEAFSENRITLHETCRAINECLGGADEVWSQGPQFDMVMLENLFKMKGETPEWRFWKIRDSRTLFSLLPTDPRKEVKFVAHSAVGDAVGQSKAMLLAFDRLGVKYS